MDLLHGSDKSASGFRESAGLHMAQAQIIRPAIVTHRASGWLTQEYYGGFKLAHLTVQFTQKEPHLCGRLLWVGQCLPQTLDVTECVMKLSLSVVRLTQVLI